MDNLTILLLIILYIIGYLFTMKKMDNNFFEDLDMSEFISFTILLVGVTFWWLILTYQILHTIWFNVFYIKEWKD